MYLNKLLILIAISLFQNSQSKIACKSEDNTDLDWYIVIKYPNSFNFFYLSSAPGGQTWQLPNYGLDSDKNLVALTLNQAYYGDRNTFYAFYNDEKPRLTSPGDHLKGVVNIDKESGYWLVHSVPRFPLRNGYYYPVPQHINGQSFICVSLKLENFNAIATQLLMMYAIVYDHYLPENFTNDPNLENNLIRLVNNMHEPGVKTGVLNFTTIKNVPLVHFGKSKQYEQDLYASLMAPGLKSNLYVESWMHGNGNGGQLPSDCQSKYKVFNVKKVKINKYEFDESRDHSKWAVTSSIKTPAVCIGDINRMETQFFKGGGSLCIFNSNVWTAFNSSVFEYEKCKK